MSQPVYLEETSYRLVERLTLAAEKIADKIEEHVPPDVQLTKDAISLFAELYMKIRFSNRGSAADFAYEHNGEFESILARYSIPLS